MENVLYTEKMKDLTNAFPMVCFSLFMAGTFEGVVSFGDKVPWARFKEDNLVHFIVKVYAA